mgnify:FL=1
MKQYEVIEFLFRKGTFAVLGLILPLTIMIFACFLKAAGINEPFQPIHYMGRSYQLSGLLILIVITSSGFLLYDIYHSMHRSFGNRVNSVFAARRAYFDLALVIVIIVYCLFILLFNDLDKLGNIPVGRD